MSNDYENPIENHVYGTFDEFLRERISINTVEYIVNKYSNESPEGKFNILSVFQQRLGYASISLSSKIIKKMLTVYPMKEILQAQAMFQWYKIQKLVKYGITETECYNRAIIFHNTYPGVYSKLDVNYWWYQWFLKNSIYSEEQNNLDLIDDPDELQDFEHPRIVFDSTQTDFDMIENVNESDGIENIIMESFEENIEEPEEFIIKPEIIYENDSLLDHNDTLTNYEIIEMDNSNLEFQSLEHIDEVQNDGFAKKPNKKRIKAKKNGGVKK